MAQGVPVVVNLDNGYKVLMDPNTIFWLLMEPDRTVDGTQQFNELYTKKIREDLLRDMNRVREHTAIELLELHPTSACNMACRYCYVPENTRELSHVMSALDMMRVITKFFDYIDEKGGVKRVILHGGEPCLVKKDMFELVESFQLIVGERHEPDVQFTIQTNGTLFDQEDIDFITERGIYVSLSLDGATPEVNDLTRLDGEGKSTFARVRKTIGMLKGYERCGVIVTITKHNVSHLSETLQSFSDWGVKSAIFNPVSTSAPLARDMVPPSDVLIEQYKKLIDTLIEINSGRKPEDRLVVDNVESMVMSLICSNERVLYCHMSPCGAGRFVWVVAADGTVYPDAEFMGFEEFALGNALVDSIPHIMSSPVLTRLRERHVSTIPECMACAFREICGANCPASVYGSHGTLQCKAVYCEFNKEILKYIFTLMSEQGTDVVYKLIGSDFEKRVRGARRIVWAEA